MRTSCDYLGPTSCCEKAGAGCRHYFVDATATKPFREWYYDAPDRKRAQYAPIFTLDRHWPQTTLEDYYACNQSTVISAAQEQPGGAHYSYFGALDTITVSTVNVLVESPESDPVYIRSLSVPSPPEINRPPYFVLGGMLNVKWNTPVADGEVRPENRELIIRFYFVVLRLGPCGTFGKKVEDLKFGYRTTEADIGLPPKSLKRGELYCASVAAANVLGRGFETAIGKEFYALEPPGPVRGLQVNSLLGQSSLCISWDEPIDHGLGPGRPLRMLSGLERRLWLNYTVTVSESPLELDPKKMNVFLNTSGTNFELDVLDGELTSVTLDKSILRKGVRYYVAVRARNDAFFSSFEERTDIICAIFPPDAPRNVTAQVSGNLKANISWSSPLDSGEGVSRSQCSSDDISTYIVQASDNPQFAPLYIFNASAQHESLLFSSASQLWHEVTSLLLRNKVTYYRVFAQNLAGTSVASDSVSLRTATSASSPTQVRTRVFSGNSITLEISPPVDTGYGDSAFPILGYKVQFSPNATFDSLVGKEALANSSGVYTATHLLPGVRYRIRAAAMSLAGQGNWSNVVFERSVGPPSAPRDPKIRVSGHLSLEFSWKLPSDLGLGDGFNYPISRYEVEVASSDTFEDEYLVFVDRHVLAMHPVPLMESLEPIQVTYTDEGHFLENSGLPTLGHIISTVPVVNYSKPCDCTTLCSHVNGMPVCQVVNATLCLSVSDEFGRGGLRACTTTSVVRQENLKSQAIDVSRQDSQLPLVKGLLYFMRVRAVSRVGASKYSESTPLTEQRAISRPSEPLNLRGQTNIQGMYLQWDPPLETGIGGTALALESYVIRYSASNFSSGPVNTTQVASAVRSVTIPHAVLKGFGRVFSFEVIAINIAAMSAPSERRHADYIGRANAPSIVSVAWPSSPGGSSAQITWSPPTDFGNGAGMSLSGTNTALFQLQTSRSKDFEEFESDFTEAYNFATKSPLTLTKTGLLRGSTYFFRVLCITAPGFGDPSNVYWAVSTDSAPQVLTVLPPSVPSSGPTPMTVVVDGAWLESDTLDPSKCTVNFEGFGVRAANDCYRYIWASGLNWGKMGNIRPSQGRELTNAQLKVELETKYQFTQKEWNAFDIRDLRGNDYIKVGAFFFRPTAEVNQVVFKFDTPHLKGGPTRSIAATLSYGTVSQTPTFAVTALNAPTPSVVSVTGPGVAKGTASNSWVGAQAGSGITIAVAGFPAFQPLAVKIDQSGALLTMQHMDVILASSADSPSFVHMTLRSDTLEGSYRVNVSEATTGSVVSLNLVVSGSTRMQVVEMLPSFGASGQPFHVHLKNAGDLTLANITFDTLLASCLPAAHSSTTHLLCTAPNLANFSGSIPVTVASQRGRLVVQWQVLVSTMLSDLQINSKNEPEFTKLPRQAVMYVGQNVAARFSVRTDKVADGSRVTAALRDSVGFSVTLKLSVAFVTGLEIGVDLMLGAVSEYSAGDWDGTLHNNLIPDVYDLEVNVGGALYKRKSVLRVLPSGVCETSVSPSAGPKHSAFSVTVTAAFPSSPLPVPFPTKQLEAFMGATSVAITSRQSNPTSTTFVMRVPSGHAGNVAHVRGLGAYGVEMCAFMIEEAPKDAFCPSAVQWASSTTAPASGSTQMEVHLSRFPYVDNVTHVKIALDYGGTPIASNFEPRSMTWSADSTVLAFDLPAVRIGFANVTISIGFGICASLVVEFQDNAPASMSILSPLIGVYVSSSVDVSLRVSGMPEVSSMEDLHVTIDRQPMTIVKFTSGQLGAEQRASGRSVAGPISIVARTTMTRANASKALIVVTSLKGQTLSAFGLLNILNRPTNPVVRAISPASIPMTGAAVHLEFSNFVHVANTSKLTVWLMRPNGLEQLIQIVNGSVRSSLVDLALQVAVPNLSGTSGSGVVNISVRYQVSGTQHVRADAKITLQDQRRAEIVRAWPSKGPIRGGTRVVMELRHFGDVSVPDDVNVCSPQGCTRTLHLERSDKKVFIEFETLPLHGSQPERTTMQIIPFGMLDEFAVPRFDFQYLLSAPSLTLITPVQVRLSGGVSVIMSVSLMPRDLVSADLAVHVCGKAAKVVGIHYPTVDLQGPSTSAHEQAPDVSTATIQFIAPAQITAGPYVVRLLASSVDITGTLQYKSLPPPAEIREIQPTRGTVDGGWNLSLKIFYEQMLDADHLKVNVDGVACRVIEISRRDAGEMTVRIMAPPHDAGVAALIVYMSPQHPDPASSSRLLAVGRVEYQDSDSLSVSLIHPPITMPDTTEIVILSLSNMPSKSLLSGVSVVLDGRACKPLRLVAQDSTNAVLTVEVPPMSARGMLQGSVRVSRSGASTTSSGFAVYLKPPRTTQRPASATVRRVSISRGAPSGGSVLRVAIENFAKSSHMTVASMGPDVQVRFGLQAALSKSVVRVTTDETELDIVTPPSTCTDLCTVSVTVSLLSDPEASVTFPFTYEPHATLVHTVEPSRVVQGSGEKIFIVLENAPFIDAAIALQIFVDGHAVDRATVQLLSMVASRVSVSFALPPTSSHGKLTCHLVHLLSQHGSAEFELEVMPSSLPYLMSIWPSVIVAKRASRVDLMVAHYPLYPLGSFDSNYQDISGPQPASLMVDGETMGASNLLFAKLARGGYSINATSQLSFDILALSPGRKNVTLLAQNRPVLHFELDVAPIAKTSLILLDPQEGPVKGAIATIHLAGFDYASATASHIVVMVRGQPAEVLNVARSLDVTSITVAMPEVSHAGPAPVSVSSDPAMTPVVRFDFIYLKPCDTSSVCGALDLTPRPLLPGQTSLSRDPMMQTCDASACTSLAHVHTPRVKMLSVSQGADTGGDPVRIVVSGLSITPESVLVMFGDSAARVVHASSSLSASQMLADILVISPPHLTSGVVNGAVSVAGSMLPAATFRFQYYPTMHPTLLRVSPSSCNPGTLTHVVVAVKGWRPVEAGEPLDIDTNYTSPVREFVTASLVTSDWSVTKVRFTWQCPTKEADKTTLALVRPQAFEGLASLKIITFAMTVVKPQLEVHSLFPSLGPKEGGTLVFMRVGNIIGLNSHFQNLNQAADGSTVQQLTRQISKIINVSFALNGSYVQVDLETVHQDASAVVEITFRSPTYNVAADVSFKIGGGGLGSHVHQGWRYVDKLIAGVESVTARTSSREGGTLMMLSLYGFPVLRPRAEVEAENLRYEDEIVVAFGSQPAEIVRVRASEPYPGRTVVDYRVPSSTVAGETKVLIYRSSDPISSAAIYTHTYVDMPTSLDVTRGSTRGGIVLSISSYAFTVEKESSLQVVFEQTPATIIPGSLTWVDGRTTFSLLVPAKPSATSVVVRIQSRISSQASEVTFEYFAAPEIHSVQPTHGQSSGGTDIEVSISRFPIVSSASQLAIEIGVGADTVSASATLVSSDYERTNIVITTPIGSFPPYTRSLPISVVPREFATKQERDDNKVVFDFVLVAPKAQVVLVLPASVPAFTESSIVLQIEGLPSGIISHGMSVLFGDVRTTIVRVFSTDEELTVLEVYTPRLPARAGGYWCAVDFGNSGVSAGFVLHVKDSTLLVVSVHGASGPSTGGTKMTVELAGNVRPHAVDDVVIRFGEGASSVFVKAQEIHDDGVVTKLTIITPPYSGVSKSGSAQISVTISVLQERVTAVNLMYSYWTPLRVESAILSADASSLDIRLDQPTNLRPRADLVLRKAAGNGPGPDTDCVDIFNQHTLDLMGTGPKCYVVSSSHVHVQVGHLASVLPSFIGSLHPGIQARESQLAQESGAHQPPMNQRKAAPVTFVVMGMLGDEAPLWGGIVGPSQIGPCDTAHFELTTMALQEPKSVEWSIASDSIAVQESKGFQMLTELVSAETGMSLTLRPGDLPANDLDFTLRIRILTAMGKTSTWTHTVMGTKWPIPSAKLLSSLVFSTVQPMQATAEARASQCLHLTSMGALDTELRYAWSLTNASGSQTLLEYRGSDIKHLYSVPQRGTAPQKVAVEIFAHSDPVSISTASIYLTFQPAPLVAMISGGDRAVSVAEAVSLFAQADDRDFLNLVLHYRWSCRGETASACRRADGSLLGLAMTQTLDIDDETLLAGKTYYFTVLVTSEDGRIASATSRISVWQGSTEFVGVALSQKGNVLTCGVDSVNIGGVASLTAVSTAPQVVWALQWAQEEQDEEDVQDLYSQALSIQEVDGEIDSEISIHATGLGIPTTYVFVAATSKGRSWCPVTINMPPSGGACSAKAVGPKAVGPTLLIMPVNVQCSGFVDLHTPFTYAVGIRADGNKVLGKPSYHTRQTISVLYDTADVVVRITDSIGAFIDVIMPVQTVPGSLGPAPLLHAAAASAVLNESVTDDIVERNILNVALHARTAQTALHETLLTSLINRLLPMVQAAPPSAQLTLRVVQTLLVFSQIKSPLTGVRSKVTEMLLAVSHPSLPAQGIAEDELRQCVALISNMYVQEGETRHTAFENFRFALTMEKFASTIGKAALRNLLPYSPAVNVEAHRVTIGLRKVDLRGLRGAEFHFPILADGTVASLKLPSELPADLDHTGPADVQMAQHRSLWVAGGSILLSYPFSFSVSNASTLVPPKVDFGDQEVYVTLPFNATSLSSEDMSRVYRGEGVSCVTWQGDEKGMNEGQPWTAKGCRIETVRTALDAAGADAPGLGSVVCACSHLSTFALSFRQEPVRFEDPTPHAGDLLVITAGHLLHLPVRAASTDADKAVFLSQLSVSPSPRSFVDPALSPVVASSDLQPQFAAGISLVDANISWTPMLSGSYTLSLGLFAGNTGREFYACVNACAPSITFCLSEENLMFWPSQNKYDRECCVLRYGHALWAYDAAVHLSMNADF